MKKIRTGTPKASKQPEARVFKGFFSLPFILLLFILVAAASLILLHRSVASLSDTVFFEGAGSFFLLFAAPLSLIALALALLYAIAAELLKSGKVHSSAMRNFRLVCVFAALVSALFCVFANSFIAELFSFYRVESVAEAMDSVAETAEAYERLRFLQAETASQQFLTGLNFQNLKRNPQEWLPEIRSYDPYALAVQVYEVSEEGGALVPLKEEGDSSVFLDAEQLARMSDGVDKYDETTAQGEARPLIRLKKTVRYAGFTYAALYTASFPIEIYKATAAAQKALNGFSVLERAEPLFPFFGFWLYFSFILPPLLILLLCALYIFVRISDPLAALERVCANLLQGKAGVSLIPQKYAGLDNTVSFVNARSDAIDSALERTATVSNAAEKDLDNAESPSSNGEEL